eukprot:CAMPEP_0197288478 /NCGR_PEP_ID=MMETSP0890-20130614/5567_1 /TAXON_ID=44058 ORGANISM="Aureoumbra lagunensis, Strain CCMP1510" /NCGR_SAMPLE_ID=MMETSP0890 /ASSEMBLY_ACC=CAM_ASM_000533 /LENGTH=154 /DNA_ID=CAMNT_0042759231 /DNA_START=276 /DNA_END=740 /DNA_ORIENTATION=-
MKLIAILWLTISLATAEMVHSHGQPKSGTTWLEVIVKTLAIETCKSVSECNETTSSRKYNIHLEGEGEVESFDANSGKHSLPGGQGKFKGPLIDAPGSYRKTGLNSCVQQGKLIWTGECVNPKVAFGRLPPNDICTNYPRSTCCDSECIPLFWR